MPPILRSQSRSRSRPTSPNDNTTPTTTTTTTLVTLSVEILQLLPITILNVADVKRLRTTCRRLCHVFTPYVFRKVIFKRNDKTKTPLSFPPTYVQYVQSVDASLGVGHEMALFEIFKERKHYIKSLNLWSYKTSLENIWPLVFQCNQLERLNVLSYLTRLEFDFRKWSKSLQISTPYWPKLKVLAMEVNNTSKKINRREIDFILSNVPNIQRLEIDPIPFAFSKVSSIPHFPKTLTELYFRRSGGELAKMNSEQLRNLLKTCTHLQKLGGIDLKEEDDFEAFDCFPNIKAFSCEFIEDVVFLHSWQNRFPKLEAFEISHHDHENYNHVTHIGDDAPAWKSMRKLAISGDYASPLNEFGRAFPNIETLALRVRRCNVDRFDFDEPAPVIPCFQKLTKFEMSFITPKWMEWIISVLKQRGPDAPKLKWLSIPILGIFAANCAAKDYLELIKLTVEHLDRCQLFVPKDFEPEWLLQFSWKASYALCGIDPFGISVFDKDESWGDREPSDWEIKKAKLKTRWLTVRKRLMRRGVKVGLGDLVCAPRNSIWVPGHWSVITEES